ncbi:MAG: FAD-binding oxidoreductase [Rhodobacteraceae bacterium]|nr:FAD-binding oxidoreductase [Paracoccaceae bacterium]
MLTPADTAFEADLRTRLPKAAFRPLTPAYLEEPRGLYHGNAGLLVAPGSAEEVAEVIRAAGAAHVGVVPYGGGTGLVCGQVMPDGPAPVLLSLERMTKIRAAYPEDNILIAEAGAILSDVQAAAAKADRLFPLSLASEGSARIGGNLSTNAGGVNVLRYGNARELCLGLEAVLPDGTIWHGLKRLRKDNTGYDLRGLLIGAEGTLGVITAAALRLFPRPAQEGAALMVVPGPEEALKLLALAQRQIGGGLSAFELISGMGLRFLSETMPEQRLPYDPAPEWLVLVDLGLQAGHSPEEALEVLFADAFEQGLVTDGLIAQSGAQRDDFWAMRETIPEANRKTGAITSHDVSVPVAAVPEFIRQGQEAVADLGPYRINCFGHMGDGNLHFNVFPPKGEARADHAAAKEGIQRAVHDLVHAMEGSISAEHGIGRAKVADLERYGDPAKLAAMRAIKAALDPMGIMNPGAVLRVSD